MGLIWDLKTKKEDPDILIKWENNKKYILYKMEKKGDISIIE